MVLYLLLVEGPPEALGWHPALHFLVTFNSPSGGVAAGPVHLVLYATPVLYQVFGSSEVEPVIFLGFFGNGSSDFVPFGFGFGSAPLGFGFGSEKFLGLSSPGPAGNGSSPGSSIVSPG